MKLKVNIGELSEMCAQASQTLDRQVQTALGHMYLKAKKEEDKGWLYAYSNNLNSETLIKIPAEVEEEGEILTHPGKMIDFLANRDRADQVSISRTDKRLKLQYKKSRAELGVNSEVQHHTALIKRMPLTAKASFTLKGADLAEFVRRGMFCIPPDDNGQSEQVVGGLFFTGSDEGYEAQATDGAIAAQIKVKAEKGSNIPNFMIPLRSLQPLQRLVAKRRDEDIDIVPGANGSHGMSSICFKFGDVFFTTRLLHGQFPGLKQVIDNCKPETLMRVNREELKAALARCSAFASPRSRALTLEIKKESLVMTMQGDEEIVDSVQVEHESEFDGQVKLSVGIDYLINIAAGSHADQLLLGVSGPLKPLMLSDMSDEHVSSKYVLMPVKR